MSHAIKGLNGTKPEAQQICVLYDPKDGRIIHHHMVLTYPRAQKVDEKEVERRAFKRAESFGTDTSKAKALHVSAKDINPSNRYKVDLASLKLAEIPKRPRK
jgi:hypothetical protein